jgi:two-component system OmpR family sensor kinase
MALLLAGLLVGQVMTFAVVILLPPPRAPVYHLSEVAEALQGGPLRFRDGRMLVRRIEAAPPKADPRRMHGELLQRLLAGMLRVPPQSVRVTETGPIFFFRYAHRGPPPGLAPDPSPGPPPGAPPGPPPDGEKPTQDLLIGEGLLPPGPPEARARLFADRAPLIGAFTAAVRMADGRWLTVRPPAEPFPNDWQLRLMLWFLGCLAIVGPAGYLFGRRLTAPLGRFAEAAERLGRDPRQPAMPLSGPAEIGKAAAAFNRMQERLKRYVDDRTAMVGAISHDLRTPLARIRFRMEQADPAVREGVARDLDRMEAMIDAVLAFIKDASEPSRRERLDLRSLVECVADDAALIGDKVCVAGEPRAFPVDADATALMRLFGNLVENAVKYAGGAEVRFSQDDDCAVVEVVDEGPGVPPADLERVFQPFYRAEAARTLTDDGVGLGLAVARSVARAHGGDVTLVLRPTGGLIARVLLPLAAPAKGGGRASTPSLRT